MRLARVVSRLEPGGAQLTAIRLTAALRECGFDTRLLAGNSTREGLALCRSFGVEPEVYGGGADLQYGTDKAFVRWLGPRIDDADIVHAHMFGSWWAAARALEPGVPLVASEHNAMRWPTRPRLRELRSALRRVQLFFAHGPHARQLVLKAGLHADRLRAGIAPVPDLDATPLPELPSPRIVFAGRFHHEKGPDTLVEALAKMRRPPATLMLGAGALEPALRERVGALGLGAVVRFQGWQHRPAPYIAGASVLAVPSRHESWSQSAVMAMGLGVPVVGAAVEGLPITLGGGRGVLVPPDDPVALAGALEQVLAGRHDLDLAAASEYAHRYSTSRVASVYASAYGVLVEHEQHAALSAA